MARKSSGLGQGTGAFWQSERRSSEVEPEIPAEAAPPPKPKKPKKVRTTVTLYPDTLAKMEEMKVQARREGVRATYSDILGDAIDDLARKRGIEFPES